MEFPTVSEKETKTLTQASSEWWLMSSKTCKLPPDVGKNGHSVAFLDKIPKRGKTTGVLFSPRGGSGFLFAASWPSQEDLISWCDKMLKIGRGLGPCQGSPLSVGNGLRTESAPPELFLQSSFQGASLCGFLDQAATDRHLPLTGDREMKSG